MKNIAIFISGRGSNFINIHKNILDGSISNCRVAVVFSDRSDALGLNYAKENNINFFTLDKSEFSSREEFDKAIVNELKAYDIHLICLAGYMRIVSEVLTSSYPNKIINIHPSLLPSFAGLHAQRQAIEYGVKLSGATVHFVDNGLDSGAIILQASVNVEACDDERSLSEKILTVEHKIYPKAIQLFLENRLKINKRYVEILED